MTTPAEIAKLTEQVQRGKSLMKLTSAATEKAKGVFDNYEQSLENFNGHLTRIARDGAALDAMMAGMGNAGPVLDAAFQDGGDKPKAVDAQPTETAHLAKTG